MASVTESPYELLDVSPAASTAEIMKAYQAALRDRRHPPQQLANAFHLLRATRSRLEQDLLVAPSPGPDPRDALVAASDVGEVGELPSPESMVLLDTGRHARLWRDVPPSTATFEGLPTTPPDSSVLPPFPFPIP